MSNVYYCDYCGRDFQFKRDRDTHQGFCGVSRIDEFESSRELTKIGNISNALHRNDYDENDDSGAKTRQKTLRNTEVSY